MWHYHLSLSEKVKAIEAKEENKPLAREIMLKFKCGKTQIYETLKHKDKIVSWCNEMAKWMKNINFLLDIRKKKQLPEHELLVTAYIKIHTVYNLFNTVYVLLNVLK